MKEKERFEILLEHIAKDVRTVAEGHISLDRKMDRGLEEARIDRESMKQQLSLVAQTLAGKIDKNREGIELNRKKIEEVDQKVEINREKIEEVDDKLDSSLKKHADHEERIKVLEAIN